MPTQIIKISEDQELHIDVKLVDTNGKISLGGMGLEHIRQVVNQSLRTDISSRSRKEYIAFSRHAFCYIAHKVYGFSQKSVGRTVGRDHTTVINSYQKYRDLMITHNKIMLNIFYRLKDQFPLDIDPR